MLPGRGSLFAGYQELEEYGLMDPARDIGGDLYDAFFIAPRRLALTIGDVSGKGIPAALFMARVIAQLRQVAAKFGNRRSKRHVRLSVWLVIFERMNYSAHER